MKVSMMLAEFARVANGKFDILGGGWSRIWGTIPFSIALKLELAPDETRKPHRFKVEMIDADGAPVTLPGDPPRTFGFEGQYVPNEEADAPGVDTDHLFAIGVPPLELPVGRYCLRVWVDDETRRDWQLSFSRVDRPEAMAA